MIVAHDDAPDVVAVVPTLGGAVPRLRACLDSVLASDAEARLAVVVVWNDPRRPVPALERVTVLEPGLNLGFPGGLNHGRAAVDARYLWVVQDDVVVEPSCLAMLLARMAQDDATGLVGAVTLDERGLVRAGQRGGVLDGRGGMAYHVPLVDSRPEDVHDVVDWVSSSGALARLSAWDAVGGFDPAFFPLLWSDVDFGRRLAEAGFRSVLDGSAHIRHELNGSTPSLLGQHLSEVQSARFGRKSRGEEPDAVVDDGIDPVTLGAVARSATLGYVDLAGFAARRDAQVRAERDEALEQLKVREQQVLDLGGELERLRAVEARHEHELRERAAHDAAARAAELAAVTAELAALRGTWSWRLTAPLRALRGLRRRAWSPRR